MLQGLFSKYQCEYYNIVNLGTAICETHYNYYKHLKWTSDLRIVFTVFFFFLERQYNVKRKIKPAVQR